MFSPPQQQPPSQGPPPTQPGLAAPMTTEQYHLLLLQHQLRQTQAHAQAQAQLLALYQQQQQQQQQMSAATAYHHALLRNPAYGNPYAAYTHYNPSFAVALPTAAPQPSLLQQQQAEAQAQLRAAAMAPPTQPMMSVGIGAVPAVPSVSVTVGGPRRPPPTTANAEDETDGADARLHASLAGTAVEWISLPPRYVMDSVASTAAANKLAQQAADPEQTSPQPKTVFIGGISYDVARDPRVLPWLAASVAKRPIVVKKVIPHKERRARQRTGADASATPKLALSAFAVVDADDVNLCIDALHHRVLWDLGGCWIARTPEAVAQLHDYANAQCTWQRREAGASLGLPRHMMTVELATAAPHRAIAPSSAPCQQVREEKPPVAQLASTGAVLRSDAFSSAAQPTLAPPITPPDAPPVKLDWNFVNAWPQSRGDAVETSSSNSSEEE